MVKMKALLAAAALSLAIAPGCGDATETGTDNGTTQTDGGGTTTDGGTTPTDGGDGSTDGGTTTAPGTIVDVLSKDARFSTLVAAVQKAGYVELLADASKSFTVFAPTNEAFAALLTNLGVTGGLDALSVAQLQPVLRYHVLGAEVKASDAQAAAGTRVDTLGGKLAVGVESGAVVLDGRAKVTEADVDASNGVIHVVDSVLLPSIADIVVSAGNFSSLTAALQLADTDTTDPKLVQALDDDAGAKLTVFAPDDAAFTAAITRLAGTDSGATTGVSKLGDLNSTQVLPVLKYHVHAGAVVSSAIAQGQTNLPMLGGTSKVVVGSGVKIDGADVTTADILASNGVIHVVNKVLLPSIADLVRSDSRFSSLATAVTVADTDPSNPGIVGTLDDDSLTLTVFAPPNGAFDALVGALAGSDSGATTGVSSLADLKSHQLLPVLGYHVTPGAAYASAVAAGALQTLGGSVAVTVDAGGVKLDGTQVLATNIFASNGVVHVIGGVLIPSIADVVTTAPEFEELAKAVVASTGAPNVAQVLDGAGPFTLFAPSNSAFAALPSAPAGQALTDVLTYHVTDGAVYASQALALTQPLTLATKLASASISVSVEGSPAVVKVSDSSAPAASVIGANYFTSNGVIHAIDQVLIP
jgi:transforming growth factor-beta-induced protein